MSDTKILCGVLGGITVVTAMAAMVCGAAVYDEARPLDALCWFALALCCTQVGQLALWVVWRASDEQSR